MKSLVKTAKCIDLHSHLYLPKYIEILKQRNIIPRVTNDDRLIILPNENQKGRPIGQEYISLQTKYKFMELHNISQSVISLANPWADFIDDSNIVQKLNQDLFEICEQSNKKLLGFGVLPTGCSKQQMIKEVQNLAKMKKYIKGIILSLNGTGNGLHDENLIDVLGELANNDLLVFVHPHYGVGQYDQKYGHILPLAFGFTFETTQRIGEFIISGTLDRFDNKLNILLAHSGGALPYLSGRLDSCYIHDHNLYQKLKRYELPSDYLKNCFYYDAISYNKETLNHLIKFAGIDRIVFGTDHPFFPPINQGDITQIQWDSCLKNQYLIQNECNMIEQKMIMYQNANRLLNIENN